MTSDADTSPSTLAPSVSLNDKFDLDCDRIFASGPQALVRALLTQRALDQANGLNTAGYVSGYRGSPLGGVDLQLWRARAWLEESGVRFEPGLNEDLAATAVLGTQQAAELPSPKHDGVFSMWYGKGPGVDRAGDALKHGSYAGSSKHGGVLAVFGDDHAGKSSTVAHQSEHAMASFCIPVLYPASVQEYVDFAVAGWAMSRYSGCWVGFKAVNETVETTASIASDAMRYNFVQPDVAELPAQGLHVNLRYTPIEDDLIMQRYRLPMAQAFVRANALDRAVINGPKRRLGVVAAGKSYLDVMEALKVLGMDRAKAESVGLCVYKVALSWPLEPNGIQEFASGLDELMFVEEKRAFMEPQAAHVLFNLASDRRPRLIGKQDESGNTLFPSDIQLTASVVAQVIAARLDGMGLADEGVLARARGLREDAERAALISGASLLRTPYFCSGCPHNRSTKTPEGSIALNGIGCHGMSSLIRENNVPPTQMGAEGATWIGASHFSNTPHVFQNLGDGTYTHSGVLAVRAAVAAGTDITYKLLFNDAVAMTGGQPAEGSLSVDQISRQLAAEGVGAMALVTDEPHKYARGYQFDPRTTIYDRRELDHVQREMQKVRGVTAIIYDQTCAAEKRRRRKRGQFADPARRAFINHRVCEGCGDCSVQANCVSIQPLDTEYGRKRVIDQSSCNKDYSCIEGFCPSFVTVEGGAIKKAREAALPAASLAALPEPDLADSENGYAVLINGVGGTGVITIGAVIGMAAHIEKRNCSVFDMTGLSQKGGAVFSHLKIGVSSGRSSNTEVAEIGAPKIAVGEANLILGCDLVVSAGTESLATCRGGLTRAVINGHLVPTGAFQLNPDLELNVEPMHAGIESIVGSNAVDRVDASGLSRALLGDTIGANMLMVGYALQRGLLPVSLSSIVSAIELNGIAVDLNLKALAIGRLAAHDPAGLSALLDLQHAQNTPAEITLTEMIERRQADLVAYQDAAYAARYRAMIDGLAEREQAVAPGSTALTRAAARYLFKLMAYKDEYEVARMYSDGEFQRAVAEQFDGDYSLRFHLAPPLLPNRHRDGEQPRKYSVGAWMMPVFEGLTRLKGLRGTPWDVFGYAAERRTERRLRDDYIAMLGQILLKLDKHNLAAAVKLAEVPERIRGYGHVKQAHVTRAKAVETELLAEFESAISANATSTQQNTAATA